jgi:hypothetical protein
MHEKRPTPAAVLLILFLLLVPALYVLSIGPVAMEIDRTATADGIGSACFRPLNRHT